MSDPMEAIAFLERVLSSINLALQMELTLSEGIMPLMNHKVRNELGVDYLLLPLRLMPSRKYSCARKKTIMMGKDTSVAAVICMGKSTLY